MVIASFILFKSTLGGEAFTTESLRRAEIAQSPKMISTFEVTDLNNQKKYLKDIFLEDNKSYIVGFIYTNCATYCAAQSSNFQQLQQKIDSRGLHDRVGLLSISFDPDHDSPEKVRSYAKKYQADEKIWKFSIAGKDNLRAQLFDQFGVIVIPAELGEFEHNSALLLVDKGGRIIRVFDDNQIDEALNQAISL